VRDADVLATIDFGVKALATNPRKSGKAGLGQRDVPVRFADVEWRPGEHLFADRDGIVTGPTPAAARAP
jgi:regulator of ribonuclease activity A